MHNNAIAISRSFCLPSTFSLQRHCSQRHLDGVLIPPVSPEYFLKVHLFFFWCLSLIFYSAVPVFFRPYSTEFLKYFFYWKKNELRNTFKDMYMLLEFQIILKLDGWHVTCDTWHVTCKLWYVTCCGHKHFLKISAP